MSSIERAQSALDDARSFLAPVLSRDKIEKARQASILDRLEPRGSRNGAGSTRQRESVVSRALELLHRICVASNEGHDAEVTETLSASSNLTYEPSSRRTIYGLLDLVSLEGIYPTLSPGVGIPLERRVKSVLPAGVIAKTEDGQVSSIPYQDGNSLLEVVVDGVFRAFKAASLSMQSLVRERILVDLIAALAELAFNSSRNDLAKRNHFQHIFEQTLSGSPTPELLPALTSLLNPTIPIWLKPTISSALSLVPLRPNGVRQVIEFIASTSSPGISNAEESQERTPSTPSLDSRGPLLPLEAMNQASRLLSSVPSSISAIEYFSGLAPQLFSLLDHDAGPEMAKVAGFVVGGGILGRRKLGAPGEPGWKAFAAPLLTAIDPSYSEPRISNASNPVPTGQRPNVAVTDQQLALSLKRLLTLISSHPNPGLTRRLVAPVMLPLWAISCFNRKITRPGWSDTAFSLLQTYFKVSAKDEEIVKLSENILFNGRSDASYRRGWSYSPSSDKGLEICWKQPEGTITEDFVTYLEDVDERINNFLSLLSSGTVDDEKIGAIFLGITRRWLEGSSHGVEQQNILSKNDSEIDRTGPLKMLVNIKLIQKMIEQVKDQLGHNATQLLELVQQILDNVLERDQQRKRDKADMSKPSAASLSSIVQSQTTEEQDVHRADHDPSELVSMALSLLSALLSAPNFEPHDKERALFMPIKKSLDYISADTATFSTAATTAGNLSTLLEYHDSVFNAPLKRPEVSDRLVEDRKTHSLSLTYLADTIPPVRAQGLSLLTTLISGTSAVLDIPNTTTLLISLLQDSDEYIYLNAIKTLSVLAAKHKQTVVKMLVSNYIDKDETLNLDQRLKLGEALLRTIQSLGEALTGETAKVVGEGCLAIAGRRGHKPKAHQQQLNRETLRAEKVQEANEAWGGEAPQLDDEEEIDAKNEILTRIVEGWEGRNGEEDVRIRTSALSVLGTAIEINVAGLGSSLVSTAVDLSISVLTLETGDDRAILRGAAVILIMSLIRALDKAQDDGRKLGFGFAGENLESVIRVLQYVQTTDSDGLVREHAGDVVEGLETWRSKSVLGISASERSEQSPMLDLQGERLAGLSVNLNPPSNSSKPRIQEIE
ncbi:MAG: hypothetical protein M4579_004597 [Chaenotheca gracillima]|nr:MAG: hypothetical protein M4579_004597 [Chaenotheca gracillima]